MSDRRHPVYASPNAAVYPPDHWSGSSPPSLQYPSSVPHYNSAGYISQQDGHQVSPVHDPSCVQVYASSSPPSSGHMYQGDYYGVQPAYSDGASHSASVAQTAAQQPYYSSMNQSYPVVSQRVPSSDHHPRPHDPSQTYKTYMSPVLPSQPLVTSASPPASQYAQQLVSSQSVSMARYPASPSRPFSCDMCALSFNRQHDLKRHRETHTGEKPFLCTCGKTFTRKDALKRHQLVKQCGNLQDS